MNKGTGLQSGSARSRWFLPGGYKEALVIGMPLVISMLSSTVMTFTDRIFLGHYSLDALGASMPASVAVFLFQSFFLGTVEYTGVFVAQYTGARRFERVGSSLWQGLWFCVPAGLFMAMLWFVAEPLFALGGHPASIQEQEVLYFRMLCLGGFPYLVGMCLSCFYSGRGLTKPVMLVNLCAMVINIPLDYCLINGVGFIPEMGIVGAGLATVFGYTFCAVSFAVLVFRKKNESKYRTRSAFAIDRDLFSRFMRYGLPGGVQFFMDMFAITFFIFMVGRIGAVELAATNIAISIYMLAFLPAIGMHVATSIMVGQAMGDKKPDRAAYATGSVLRLTMVYMFVMLVFFLGFPDFLVSLFMTSGNGSDEAIREIGVVLLRYAALFTLVDGVTVIYLGGLKGAGDTKYVMRNIGFASIMVMVLPMIALNVLGLASVDALWMCLLAYIFYLALSFGIRFKRGAWRKLEVIENQ